jgi:deoxyribodipyrimidine photolyase-related protein
MRSSRASEDDRGATFGERMTLALERERAERLIVASPVTGASADELIAAATRGEIPLEIRPDRTFLCSTDDFNDYAGDHRGLPLESFYRWMRKRLKILVEDDGSPVGGRWNFDTENRKGFGRRGPAPRPPLPRFVPDATTRDVIDRVERRFHDHPGSLSHFDLPMTRRRGIGAAAGLHRPSPHRLRHPPGWDVDRRAVPVALAAFRRAQRQADLGARGDRRGS